MGSTKISDAIDLECFLPQKSEVCARCFISYIY